MAYSIITKHCEFAADLVNPLLNYLQHEGKGK